MVWASGSYLVASKYKPPKMSPPSSETMNKNLKRLGIV